MNDGYISLPGLPYQQKGQYGFHQEVDEAGDTGKPGSFWRREHTHKTRLACLHSKINGVVEAAIVKEENGRLLLRCSPLDKGSTVIKKGKRKKGGNMELNAFLADGKLSTTFSSCMLGNWKHVNMDYKIILWYRQWHILRWNNWLFNHFKYWQENQSTICHLLTVPTPVKLRLYTVQAVYNEYFGIPGWNHSVLVVCLWQLCTALLKHERTLNNDKKVTVCNYGGKRWRHVDHDYNYIWAINSTSCAIVKASGVCRMSEDWNAKVVGIFWLQSCLKLELVKRQPLGSSQSMFDVPCWSLGGGGGGLNVLVCRIGWVDL